MNATRTTVLQAAAFGLILVALPNGAPAQTMAASMSAIERSPARLVVTADAQERWKSLERVTLSADGQWTAYSIAQRNGQCDLHVRRTTDPTEYRFTSRGCPESRFSGDSRFVVFTSTSSADTAGAASSSALGVVSLATGALTTIIGVSAFKMTWGQPAAVAYQMNAAGGSTFVLRTLETGAELRLENVSTYTVDERGRWLAYVVTGAGDDRDGVYLRSLVGRRTTLLSGPGTYSRLVFDKAGTQLAFVRVPGEQAPGVARPSLYLARLGSPGVARRAVPASALGHTLQIAVNAQLRFSRSGNALLFGIIPAPPRAAIGAPSAAGLAPRTPSSSDTAVVELWNSRALYVPAAQRRVDQDRRWSSYTAIYWSDTDRWLRLGADDAPQLRVNDDASIGLAVTSAPYPIQGSWGDVRYDIYTVNPRTGHRALIRRAIGGPGLWFQPTVRGDHFPWLVAWSPTGKYLLLYERGQWSSHDMATGRVVDLTTALPVAFGEVTNANRMDRGAWGVAGWTAADGQVLVYDEFDVWAIDPSGSRRARNVTAGMGRRLRIRFRLLGPGGHPLYAANESDGRSVIDATHPVLLAAENLETRETGFWRARLDGAVPPIRLTMAAARLRIVAQASEGERYLLRRETYREYPDLWTTDRLEAYAYTRLTDVNPQQAEYRWGTAELIHVNDSAGKRLAGVLYKPEDFDPARKYPLLVSVYERLSPKFHEYESPEPNVGPISVPAAFTSRGYLVLRPDITYTIGHTCESAVAAVVPAVQSLIARGLVDPKRVAVTGHSFGGYETACIITRTEIFRAAIAANGPMNRVSQYGYFSHRDGTSTAALVEMGQGRLAATPWDAPMVYIENSPVFRADRITTPLLVLHNDGDDTVPWEEGLQLFAAMRRLGKEMYLLNYRGQGHQLDDRAAAFDWDRRFHEFLGHLLMCGPRPSWMGGDVLNGR